MTLFSKRLLHVVTRKDLAILLAPVYAAAENVDFDEAFERMERAVGSQRLVDEIYGGLSDALYEFKGARITADELIDKLSKGVQERRTRVKAAPVTPALSAAMVLINLDLGYAPEMMRGALETPKGKALQKEGLKQLGLHWLKSLIK